MLKVELINKEEIKELFKNWGVFACQCYNTNEKFAEKVGQSCFKSGHFSGSRCEYFKFKISGISRACSLQLNRHSQGIVINQQSQRYVDMINTEFVIPHRIKNNENALSIYKNLIEQSKKAYLEIQEELLNQGFTKEQANEEARYGLLESCETSGVWGFTLEALIHFMNLRLCSRSQHEIRQLANVMKDAVLVVLPELENDLVPKCKKDLFCTEEKCCGLALTKNQVVEVLKLKRYQDNFKTEYNVKWNY